MSARGGGIIPCPLRKCKFFGGKKIKNAWNVLKLMNLQRSFSFVG